MLANDSNFKLLQYLLEILNSVIEHNFNSNPHLIYAILRSHKKFEALQDMTLSSGIETLNAIRKAREEREKEGKDDTKTLWIVVSSDRGLCGGIHSAVSKRARKEIGASSSHSNDKLVILGDKPKAQLSRSMPDNIVLSVSSGEGGC